MKGGIIIYYLLFFLLGIITYEYIFPILESISALICQQLELKKGGALVKLTEYNCTIQEIQAKYADTGGVSAIGFALPETYVEEEEEYEDYED